MKALHKGTINKYKVRLWVELAIESDHGIILMTYVQFKLHINIKQAVEYYEQDK